ncbi:5135_t:CDS:2 [Funneliformis geosporum]|uniref:5135_t:CDS:1 n=1 Tax=Funneliformis geosporum TaxID=1117311 RepID=A0A9W4SI06_9GLOM|nr:5135_t:CDS:2 [Funneliformis geosporum]
MSEISSGQPPFAGLEFLPKKSTLHARFTGNWTNNAGIYELDDGLLLDRWYHLAYTLSDSEKRLDVYIDGEWVGFYCIQNVKTEKVVFNDGPLYIGRSFDNGFNGEICNVRYFNWRLCAEEVKQDYFDKQIVYGSKVTLFHVPTSKYLSKSSNMETSRAVGINREDDFKNCIFTVIEAYGTNVNTGNPLPFNTTFGFKHQATGGILHSHATIYGVTPVSKHQEVLVWYGRDNNDDWIIRRYNPNASKEVSDYLMSSELISISHKLSDKLALYSHPILLEDGTQEVSCHGNGNDENIKWCIELIDDSKL